jgi:hypothetical protein
MVEVASEDLGRLVVWTIQNNVLAHHSSCDFHVVSVDLEVGRVLVFVPFGANGNVLPDKRGNNLFLRGPLE